MFYVKKKKAIKGTPLQSKANFNLDCTSVQIGNTNDRSVSYLWCKKFYEVQGGERELKRLLEVFGQLIVVIKDRKY